jgi:hypothetical protein
MARKRNPRQPKGGRGEAPRGWFIENPYSCNEKTKKALPNCRAFFVFIGGMLFNYPW